MLNSFDTEIAGSVNACWTSYDADKSAAASGYYNAAYLSATTPDPLISIDQGLDEVFFSVPYVPVTAILLDYESAGVEQQPAVVDSEIVRTVFYGTDESDIVSPATAEVVNNLLEQSRLEVGGVTRGGNDYTVAESPAAPNSIDQLIAHAFEAGIDYDILSNFTIQPSSVQKLPISSSAVLLQNGLFENVSDAGEDDEEIEQQQELAASCTITHAKSPSVLIISSPRRYNKRPRDATPSATLTLPPPPSSSSPPPPSVEILDAPLSPVKKTRTLETDTGGGADVACNLDKGSSSVAPTISRDALFAALKHLRPADMTVILPTTASTSEAENSSLRNMSSHATSFSSTSSSSSLLRPLRFSPSRNDNNNDSSSNDSSAAETMGNGKMNFSSSDDAADGESTTSTNPRGRPRHSESKSARYARQHRLVAKQRRENMFEKRDKLRAGLADMEKQIDSWNEEKASLIAKLRESYAQASEAMKSKLDSTLFL